MHRGLFYIRVCARAYMHACRVIPCPKSWLLLEAVLKPPRATLLNELYLVHASYEGYEPLVKAEYKLTNGICEYPYAYVYENIDATALTRAGYGTVIANLQFSKLEKYRLSSLGFSATGNFNFRRPGD